MHSWYLDAYQTLNDYIFGGTVVVGSYEDMLLCMLSFCMVLAVIALPFCFLVGIVKKMLISWWS